MKNIISVKAITMNERETPAPEFCAKVVGLNDVCVCAVDCVVVCCCCCGFVVLCCCCCVVVCCVVVCCCCCSCVVWCDCVVVSEFALVGAADDCDVLVVTDAVVGFIVVGATVTTTPFVSNTPDHTRSIAIEVVPEGIYLWKVSIDSFLKT